MAKKPKLWFEGDKSATDAPIEQPSDQEFKEIEKLMSKMTKTMKKEMELMLNELDE